MTGYRFPMDAAGDVLSRTGARVIGLGRSILMLFSTGIAVIVQAGRPLTWRRTVRTEFVRHCYLVGVHSLALTAFVGVLLGVGLVFQALYWLKLFGESDLIGRFLVLVLLRELGPLMVGFIVLGRSGSIMLAELGTMQARGQVHMLDAMGVDPFLFLVIPRVLATALCTFGLSVVLNIVSLASGYLTGNALNLSRYGLLEFVYVLLQAMGPSEFAILLLKPLGMGFAVALIACTTGLVPTDQLADVPRRLPRGFVRSVVAIFLITGFFSLIL
jgi:phospholipid/cholesterol/gamma-HCH transport system permease protein